MKTPLHRSSKFPALPLAACLAFFSALSPSGAQERSASEPPPGKPQTFLQIFNATSVPAISLTLNGRAIYPKLLQGRGAGPGPWEELTARYTAVNLENQTRAESELIKYSAGQHQTLLIIGDFSTAVPPDQLAQPGPPPRAPDKPFPPNVFFRVYPHTGEKHKKFLRVRIINAMPRTMLNFQEDAGAAPSQVIPGEELVLERQPRLAHYEAEAAGEKFSVILTQSALSDRMVVFYLKAGKPVYTALSEE